LYNKFNWNWAKAKNVSGNAISRIPVCKYAHLLHIFPLNHFMHLSEHFCFDRFSLLAALIHIQSADKITQLSTDRNKAIEFLLPFVCSISICGFRGALISLGSTGY
jgi:hypothetical protein